MSELDIIADTAADYFTGSTAVREVFAEKVIEWFEATNAWLAAQCGETVLYAPGEPWAPNELSTITRRPYIILNGGSPRGEFAHCVVADAATGDIVHDPHPSRDGITSITGAFALVPTDQSGSGAA